jgi:RNA polymerase sigma-70 factor, ECF subfamily
MAESSARLRIVRTPAAPRSAPALTAHAPVAAAAVVAAGQPARLAHPEFDADALITSLYAENAAFVLSYVTKLLGDRYLAEDVLQETMLRAWRHCEQFSDEKGSVRGWLLKVAHNIAMDKIRMRRSRPAEVAEDSVGEPMVEDHADAVLTTLQIRHALSLLSPGHRAVLEQIYLHGRTTREAAARLGIPEGTAFSRSYYALRILRHELGVNQPPAQPRTSDEDQAA